MTYLSIDVNINLEYSVIKTSVMGDALYIKVSKDYDSSFVHFWVIPNDQTQFHSSKKMVVIPPIDMEKLWKDLSEYLPTTPTYVFEPSKQTDQGLVVRITKGPIFSVEEFVVELQTFFDTKYPPYLAV